MSDIFYMKQAVALAKKGMGCTSPNPSVGAVIVKNGKIIGSGYHKKAGEPHAEIMAINDALKKKNLLNGATLYVNLEPCCHEGRTPSCTSAIVHFGIKKVVIAHKDPSKKVDGKGIKFLKKHGVEVISGVMEEEARMINQPFLKVSKYSLPFVTLKAGISLDGKISTGSGKSEWITNEISREHGHKLRDSYDAIVIGANTVKIDNPVLDGNNGKLFRVVIDGRLSTNVSSRVYRDGHVFVAYADTASSKNIKKFKDAGIKIENFGKNKVDIKKLIQFLYKEFEIQSVFVEGGGEVHGSFVDARVVDDIYFYISPEIIGGRNSISVVGGNGVKTVKNSLKLKKVDVSRLKDDILVHGVINYY